MITSFSGKRQEIGERVYKESQEIGDIALTIDSLLLKAIPEILRNLGRLEDSLQYVLEAEKKFKEIDENLSSDYMRRKASILSRKASFYLVLGNSRKARRFALQSLEIWEKFHRKIDVAYTFQVIGNLNMNMGDRDAGLDYTMKSLSIQEELNNRVGIAASLWFVEWIYNVKGYFNQAIEAGRKVLAMKEISNIHKILVLGDFGAIYKIKGELNQALRYSSESLKLAEKENDNFLIGLTLVITGDIYEMKGNDIKAIEYYQRSLAVFQKIETPGPICVSLGFLINIYIEKNSRKQAHQYLERLKNLFEKFPLKRSTHIYLNAKAYFLKTSGRTRDRAEAEIIWRQVVNDKISFPAQYIEALGRLCEFLIEELEMSTDSEILNELNPLISRWHNIAEKTQSHLWLAETKLLQAKVTLINMKIEEGEKLMTEAQRVAESHGLTRLAQRISYEHDTLLHKIDEWDKLKDEDAPMADLIELASFDGVINRLKGRQAIDPPDLVEEEPILLLVMDNSGATYFNHPFAANWDYSDLFSSFMSAFNTFSSEIFSKSIDRIRIGENTILINPIESFLACYVIKGQSYPALQKLTRFTEAIRANSEIWQALNKSVKTSEMLELDKPPALKTVIDEIFTQ